MSKIINKAQVSYNTAKNEFRNSKIDLTLSDAYIDHCCFNLQQAIEMYLKGIIELQGNNYVTNHDLRAQINRLDLKDDVLRDISDEIKTMATTLNLWETDSQYSDSFVAVAEDVEAAFDICERLDKYCKSLFKVEPISYIN